MAGGASFKSVPRRPTMDFFDDFDDLDDERFDDDDSFEDEFEEDIEMDEPFVDGSELEDVADEAESSDDHFTTKEVFFLGNAMGLAYEEGLRKRKRRKWKRFGDD